MTVHSGTFQTYNGAEQRDLPPVPKAMDAAVPLQSREQNLGIYPPVLRKDLKDAPTCIPPRWIPWAYLPPGWLPTQVLGLLPAPLGLTVLVPFRNKNGKFGFSWSNYIHFLWQGARVESESFPHYPDLHSLRTPR